MKKNPNKLNNDTNGFTLTELLIATAILGCLAALAAVRYSTSIEHTRYRRARANLISIRTAADIYKENSSDDDYPATQLGLTNINNAFNLHLSDPDFTYTFTNNGDGTFTATAVRSNPAYTLTVDQTSISSSNPSCSGACPCTGTCS